MTRSSRSISRPVLSALMVSSMGRALLHPTILVDGLLKGRAVKRDGKEAEEVDVRELLRRTGCTGRHLGFLEEWKRIAEDTARRVATEVAVHQLGAGLAQPDSVVLKSWWSHSGAHASKPGDMGCNAHINSPSRIGVKTGRRPAAVWVRALEAHPPRLSVPKSLTCSVSHDLGEVTRVFLGSAAFLAIGPCFEGGRFVGRNLHGSSPL